MANKHSALIAERLTRKQAALIGVYTGVLCGPFSDLHEKIEQLCGRPVFTHEMANKDLMAKVADLAKAEFLSICATE